MKLEFLTEQPLSTILQIQIQEPGQIWLVMGGSGVGASGGSGADSDSDSEFHAIPAK